MYSPVQSGAGGREGAWGRGGDPYKQEDKEKPCDFSVRVPVQYTTGRKHERLMDQTKQTRPSPTALGS